jgi:predicted nucleic acid-binding protein
MIHLDTNLLIGAEDPTDPHHRQVLSRPDAFACSAVAWMEFLSYPGVPLQLQVALKCLLAGGIVPFDETTAALAGEIFHLTGSKRRTRLYPPTPCPTPRSTTLPTVSINSPRGSRWMRIKSSA